ncbi:MAG: hypothetical protein QXU18_12255 [Thermoplasmatales archaeon]
METDKNKVTLEAIGKTTSPMREPNSSGSFSFWLQQGIKLNPFDFVVAEHMDGSKTIGAVEEIFAYTDSESHLTDFVGNDLGNPSSEPFIDRLSAMVGKSRVLRNIREDDQEENYMPIPVNSRVYFADKDAIMKALGFDEILGKPIPSGIIKQSNGTIIPVFSDSSYILGPEAGHVNAAGISGLATKTSYLMFMIYSIWKKIENTSVIIFNVKHSDLLHIDEQAADLSDFDKRMYQELGLDIKPFDGVKYFLPKGRIGPDSDDPPNNYTLYSYLLSNVFHSLDLLFADLPDENFTIDAYVHYVRSHWNNGRIEFRGKKGSREIASNWEELKNIPLDIIGEAVYNQPRHSTPARLQRELGSLTGHSIFETTRKDDEVYLGEAVKNNIKKGSISVIDIYRLPTRIQPFVVGDVMRNIEGMYREKNLSEIPNLIIFIDELNTFAPVTSAGGSSTPIAEQLREIAIKGRGRRMALFGAEQFKSQVDQLVWGNSSLQVIGRLGSSELSTSPYRELDDPAKRIVLNLRKGEVLLAFKVWRSPIKITFPRPPYKRPNA